MPRHFIPGVLFALILGALLLYILRSRPMGSDDGASLPEASPAALYDGTPRGLIEAALHAHGLANRPAIPGVMTENTVMLLGDAPGRRTHSVEWYRFPDRARIDSRIGPSGGIYVYDGLHGWSLRHGTLSETSDQVTENLRRSIKIRPVCLLPAALDERSILGPVATDSTGDRPMLTLRLTDPEGDQTRIAVDAESFLLTRVDYALFSSAGIDSMRVQWWDYADVDGIRTAREASILRNGVKVQQNRVQTTRYDPALPDSLFVRPSRPAAHPAPSPTPPPG